MEEKLLRFNQGCAALLGWQYLGWQEAKEAGPEVVAGWYSVDPRTLNFRLKLHRDHYKCRSHTQLRFHLDWNWIQLINVKLKWSSAANPADEGLLTMSRSLAQVVGDGDLAAAVAKIQEILDWCK